MAQNSTVAGALAPRPESSLSKPLSPDLIAQRIQQALKAEIDHDIQVDRLVVDGRYARDVLLVCDALTEGDLPALAAMFREGMAAQVAARTANKVPAQAAERQTVSATGLSRSTDRPEPAAAAPASGRQAKPPQRPGHAAQANDWGGDTSGFGVTHPPPLEPETRSAGQQQGERRRLWPWPRE